MKAILFDMNGTIIDDEAVHEAASTMVFAELGIKLTHEEYMKYFFGRTDNDGFKDMCKLRQVKQDLHQFIRRKAQAYQSLAGDIMPIPGVVELIKCASEYFTLGLVSGAIREEIESTLSKFGIRQYFSIIISANEVIHGKPDPEPYLLASTHLHIKPEECIVIEDSLAGIMSAKKAGMYCIAYSPNKELTANKVISSYFELSTSELKALKIQTPVCYHDLRAL